MSRKQGCRNKKETVASKYIDDSPYFKKIDENTCLCVICGCSLTSSCSQGSSNLKRHEKTVNHIENINYFLSIKNKSYCHAEKEYEIHEKIITAFLSSGIPLNVLDNNHMKTLFMDCFGFRLKTGQTYRAGILPKINKEKYLKIIDKFYDKNFCLYFDETTDANGRYILNIMGKILIDVNSKCWLLSTVEVERTNTKNVLTEINFILGAILKDRTLSH